MKLPAFDYACPETLEEATALLAEAGGDAKVIAGGQSLLPFMAFRLAAPSLLVDLRKIAGLRSIEVGEGEIRLGAMVRWRDILDSAALARALPVLPAAIGHVAHYQIRNRGTLGGSLAHADPASEFPCIAVLCGASVDVVGAGGRRTVPAGDLIAGPMEATLEDDEIIVATRFPRWPEGRRWAFDEFALRHGDLAIAAVAACYDMDGPHMANARVAVMGATDTPQRVPPAENALNGHAPGDEPFGRAAEVASAAIEPTEDLHAGAAYRRALVGTLLRRGLQASCTRQKEAAE
ncbi:MAG: xanthine dehydrogenase family protein subunit M [Paracoccaceae bacterium]|jgi:carbon-monoxide dehydrogenase medium subunit|nr:xanthine dehydrogenase family protein subunit M [Paracoccaceae bacterium]